MSVGEAPVFEAVGLWRTYQEGHVAVPALSGVDLTVAQGEFLVVAGPSGSGKSTLLHLLGGLDRPDRGEVRIGGRGLASCTERERTAIRRDFLGFVFQAFNLVPVLSAGQPLNLPVLSFALGHAASLRRLAFRAWEQESADFAGRFGIGYNYGYPRTLPDAVKAEYGDVAFDRMTAGGLEDSDKWRTPEGAASWVIETLERLGIEVEKATLRGEYRTR